MTAISRFATFVSSVEVPAAARAAARDAVQDTVGVTLAGAGRAGRPHRAAGGAGRWRGGRVQRARDGG